MRSRDEQPVSEALLLAVKDARRHHGHLTARQFRAALEELVAGVEFSDRWISSVNTLALVRTHRDRAAALVQYADTYRIGLRNEPKADGSSLIERGKSIDEADPASQPRQHESRVRLGSALTSRLSKASGPVGPDEIWLVRLACALTGVEIPAELRGRTGHDR